MRKKAAEFITESLSQPGTFRVNYDYFSFIEVDNFACWIIADGINSELEKKSAEIAVKYLLNKFALNPGCSSGLLKKYLQDANQILQKEGQELGLSASILMVISNYAKIIYGLAGNTRLYYFSGGQLVFRSSEQNFTQVMFETGKISENEVNSHNERNNLSNYLGISNNFEPFISKEYCLNDGDVLVLCTVGYWEKLHNYEIVNQVRNNQSSELLIDDFERLFKKNQEKLLDNYTVAVVAVKRVFRAEKKVALNKIKRMSLVFLVILLILGTGSLISQIYQKKRVASITVDSKGTNKVEELMNQATKRPTEQTDILIKPSEKPNDQKQIEVKPTENSKVKEGVDYSKDLDLIKLMEQSQSTGEKNFYNGFYQMAKREFRNAETLAKKIKSLPQASLFHKRIELIENIVKANYLFKKGEYQNSLDIYRLAEQGMLIFPIPSTDLKKKIEVTESSLKLVELINQSELAYQKKDYKKAKSLYNEARALTSKYSLDELMAKTEAGLSQFGSEEKNLSNLESLKTSMDKTLMDAKELESEGDQKYEARDYRNAYFLYDQAKKIYEALTENEAGANVSEKQAKAERKADSLFSRLFEK